MEVIRSNFLSTLPKILDAISSADFISIDGEFTGLSNGSVVLSNLDSPKMRYLKLKHNQSVEFLLLQVGICTFHKDASSSFTARPFNIFIFPRSFGRTSPPDGRFLCQASSIEFLVAQDFDFNKTFKEGIGYLPLTLYKQMKEELELKDQERKHSSPKKCTAQ